MVRITPIYKPWNAHLEGEQPYLGDLLTKVINHFLTGMILQACHSIYHWFFWTHLPPKRKNSLLMGPWAGNSRRSSTSTQSAETEISHLWFFSCVLFLRQSLGILLSEWNPEIKVWTLFSLPNICNHKKFESFSHWPFVRDGTNSRGICSFNQLRGTTVF